MPRGHTARFRRYIIPRMSPEGWGPIGSHWVQGMQHNTCIDEEGDVLTQCDFSKVSIVTLNERTARIAKREIETRTRAKVIIVSDLSAGEGTDSALLSDVVLFVSGAVKHAVYRAFDGRRDILEYVQGKGSSSIVRALERRVRRLAV